MQLVTEIPVEADEFALGVAIDPFTVTPELGIVLGEQQQTGIDPGPEGVDEGLIAEMGANFPVGRHRAEVDDGGVSDRCLLWCHLGVGHGRKLYLVHPANFL